MDCPHSQKRHHGWPKEPHAGGWYPQGAGLLVGERGQRCARLPPSLNAGPALVLASPGACVARLLPPFHLRTRYNRSLQPITGSVCTGQRREQGLACAATCQSKWPTALDKQTAQALTQRLLVTFLQKTKRYLITHRCNQGAGAPSLQDRGSYNASYSAFTSKCLRPTTGPAHPVPQRQGNTTLYVF